MRKQREKIKELFQSNPNKWIPAYELAKIALQYNARLFSLRREGMIIENKTKMVDGIKYSWYKFIPQKNGQLMFM